MPRKKKLDPDAEQVAVYLNPAERLALSVISERRKKKGHLRTSQNEIVADGLWKLLNETEKIPRSKIEELLTINASISEGKGNVKLFPKN